MSQAKLFEYNSSFSVIRTNPKLTGNFKITIDSNGDIAFNSMDVNIALSDKKYKKYNISGKNSYARDVCEFFSDNISNEIIFQVGEFTAGKKQAVKNYHEQYDFFYASGANILVDGNYKESFNYFAPIWIKNEVPDFFVIFKLDNPLDYPYSLNQDTIESGIKYKVIEDYNSAEPFIVAYDKDLSGNPIHYNANSIITGGNNTSEYTVISGSGKVAIYDELANMNLVNDIDSTFRNKILNNAAIIKTFDLRETSKIGKYIRDISSNSNFAGSPLEVNYGHNSYSYYNGVSIKDGVYTKKGEMLNKFMSSSKSDIMMDFEDTITSGFQRNGIICPNLLNLEFLFDDNDSDLYTINRYFGMYVSRNDIANARLNGDFYNTYSNTEGNNNYPKITKNQIGYYYNNSQDQAIGATSGVRLFYEDANGFLPGSDDINVLNSNKLFYVTDKNENLYSFKRSEDYYKSLPEYKYGPFNYEDNTFVTSGYAGATAGTIVLQNKHINLCDFTGSDNKLATIKGILPNEAGRSYVDIEFTKTYDKLNDIVFKIYWPNGSRQDGTLKYDLIFGSDLSHINQWGESSAYASNGNYYFNIKGIDSKYSAMSFSKAIAYMDSSILDTGVDNTTSIIRLKNTGLNTDRHYSISVFDNYEYFESKYKGVWNNTSAYEKDDIVLYNNEYFITNTNIIKPAAGNSETSPDKSEKWTQYNTFNDAGYIRIHNIDAGGLSASMSFIGGTETKNNRIIYDIKYNNLVKPGYYIKSKTGYSRIVSVNRYVDSLNVSDPVNAFNDFSYKMVLNTEDIYSNIDLGSDESFNIYDYAKINIGVLTFFDVKEFDFDFIDSNYSYTPTAETYKYYQIPPDISGVIEEDVDYLVKEGQIIYANTIYSKGNIFKGILGYTSFTVSDNSSKSISDGNTIVFPAKYSNIIYNSAKTVYEDIDYSNNINAFTGFLGIQKISNDKSNLNLSKLQIFNFGKLDCEYNYLNENYTIERANKSKIVPYINKWGSVLGTDARGNKYRLNTSPAFSPTNFSPSFDRIYPDSKYLTHEWLLLEEPPTYFPKNMMNKQNSYLAGKINMNEVIDADPNSLYLSKYFTVEPSDYSADYSDDANHTKEFFTPLLYNEASGFYETIFRGVKIILKKISDSPTASNKYINKYRGFENYKFSALLRAIPETEDSIQAPVKYQVIENKSQKFVLFICDIVIKDQKAGDEPKLDYTLLYTLNNKERITSPLINGSRFYEIDDIKLSAGLDLSLQSGSFANKNIQGRIEIYPNSEYETDLREEIHLTYPETVAGATGPNTIGPGSFIAPSISESMSYPWPIGVGPSYIEVGKLVPGKYEFRIPFSVYQETSIPIGMQSIYKNVPIFQLNGGENYYKSLLSRCSVSYISNKVNESSPYISYKSYEYDENTLSTNEISNNFEIYFEQPTKIIKPVGSISTISYTGPQILVGAKMETSYNIVQAAYPSILTRYSGKYEPIFRNVIYFDSDKTDKIYGYNLDLSFRNCNFASHKENFGISKNLSYAKVGLDKDILNAAYGYPEGPVYPLIGLSPIASKDFNIFSSCWDAGYYNRFLNASNMIPVAGTRSMKEIKTYFGTKVMKTPNDIAINNYISLEISRNRGSVNIADINKNMESSIKDIQNIDKTNSGTGIGNAGTYLSGVDYNAIDLNIFKDVEIIWQKFNNGSIKGIIRLDRMLRRYLLNSGIKKVFIDNIISEFGVGDPNSINDDIMEYIDLNISPIYKGDIFNLYVKKTTDDIVANELVRGDIFVSDKYRMNYYLDNNYNLIKKNNLIYEFEYIGEQAQNNSLIFNIIIDKI